MFISNSKNKSSCMPSMFLTHSKNEKKKKKFKKKKNKNEKKKEIEKT